MAIGTMAAILGGIGIGGNLLGGIFGSRAAKKAAAIQSQAAIDAGQKVEGAVRDVNPDITFAANQGGETVRRVAQNAGAGVEEAALNANRLLDPYRITGDESNEELRKNLIAGGDFNRVPTFEDLQIDPGYAFRVKQGQQTIERSAAARGGVLGGGVLKDLTTFGQESGSQEFTKAFARHRQITNDRFDRLFGVSGRGAEIADVQGKNEIGARRYSGDVNNRANEFSANANIDAADRTSQNTIGGARIAGDYITKSGDALASGEIGRGNAITGAIGGGINAATGAIQLHELLKNPGLNYFDAPRRFSERRRTPYDLDV